MDRTTPEGPHDGGCQCGAVRYRVEGRTGRIYVCHCTTCQRQSGSAFGMSWLVPREAFRLLSGELRSFRVVCDSGRTKDCAFCPDCGTRIHHTAPSDSPRLSVKPGTLDDTSWLAPQHHIWTRSRQRWLPIPEGAVCAEEEPGD